jgi:chorismate mutase
MSIRGAIDAANDEASIARASVQLFEAVMKANSLEEKDLLLVQFSLTDDLDECNPCTCLRKAGLCKEASLFCVQEARIKGSRKGIIRLLVLADKTGKPAGCYLGGASELRKAGDDR